MPPTPPRWAQPREDRPVPPVITLLTDFGLDDWYVAAMKAVLLQECPAARLLDITHLIPQSDVVRGSICLERALAMKLPPGTVHLAIVDPGVGSTRRLLVAQIQEQFIVCPDNGLISWAFRRHPGPHAFYELTWRPAEYSATFHGRDIMAPVAGCLAAGMPVDQVVRSITDPILLDLALLTDLAHPGRIIHIDHFGNATTNIPEELLRDTAEHCISVKGTQIGLISSTYASVHAGESLALIGSSSLLEIAVRDGSAMHVLGLRVGDPVQVG